MQRLVFQYLTINYCNQHILYFCYYYTNPGQRQMLLMNSERFGLLLAENVEGASVQVVVSDNIGECLSYPNNNSD